MFRKSLTMHSKFSCAQQGQQGFQHTNTTERQKTKLS